MKAFALTKLGRLIVCGEIKAVRHKGMLRSLASPRPLQSGSRHIAHFNPQVANRASQSAANVTTVVHTNSPKHCRGRGRKLKRVDRWRKSAE